MAGTLSTKKPRPVTTETGRPNMYLSTVRQSALQLAEKRWKGLEQPREETVATEFAPAVEWANICRLHFEVSGFDFTGEPAKGKPGKDVSDGKVVDVAALLAEAEAPAAKRPAALEPIRWDEVEVVTAPPQDDVAALHTVLELYEPPEKPKQAAKEAKEKKAEPPAAVPAPPKAADIVLEAVAEEPPYIPPPMAAALPYSKPELRKPPAAPNVPYADPIAATGSRLHMPSVTVLPMRQAMVAGPSPEPPAPPKPVVEAVQEVKVEARVEVVPEVKPEPKPEPKPEVKPEAKVEVKAAPAPVKAEAPAPGRKKKRHQKGGNRGPVEEVIEEPDDLGDEIEAEIAANRKVIEEPPPAPPPARKPEPPAPAAAKEEQASDVHFSFGGMADAPIEAPKTGSIGLGLSSDTSEPPAPAGMSTGVKAGIAVAVLAVGGAVAMFTMGGSSSKEPAKPAALVSVMETAGMVMGEAGWSTDYTTEASGKRVRQMAFYRPSMQITDYRIEFQAEIEYKAAGWAVRAANPKTYWALKLFQDGVRVKLRRFSVTDGKDGAPTDLALPFPTNAGMIFKVRTDVVGKKFVVTVNDQKVDEWTDTQIATGGFGVANEGAERGQIRSIQLWHLRERQVSK
ncbi:MAG: hypothetical protein JST93_10475 [Acidobacteria bacterium]|nr:hypothetical protein [Acidobacteriota bacterium]